MVGFKGSTQEKSIFEIFRFRLKKSPHDKKVPDRVGPGLMFGGDDAVFDKLSSIYSQSFHVFWPLSAFHGDLKNPSITRF
jgi:hypothetical protein